MGGDPSSTHMGTIRFAKHSTGVSVLVTESAGPTTEIGSDEKERK
jgi:hypothetical protein